MNETVISKNPLQKDKPHTLKEQGFYHTVAWRRLRVLVLRRDHYLCQKRLKNKHIKRAAEVHHVRPVGSHPEQALELSNLESLCRNFHESTRQRRVERVYPARVIKVREGSEYV